MLQRGVDLGQRDLDPAGCAAVMKRRRRGPLGHLDEGAPPRRDVGADAIEQRHWRTPHLQLSVYPHMLRHGCGFALANAGHDTRSLQAYLGHRNIQHTVRYTELAPDRFKNFWRA
jgi:integrase